MLLHPVLRGNARSNQWPGATGCQSLSPKDVDRSLLGLKQLIEFLCLK